MSSAYRSIGEVLQLLEGDFPEVTISKIRFLESQGLLSPDRTPSGYRKFKQDDVEQLRWILTQQRDNFLPLRVIRERINSGNWHSVGTEHSVAPASAVDVGTAPVQAEAAPFQLDVSAEMFTLDELAHQADIDINEVRELQKYGVVEPVVLDPPMFDDDALVIAKAAGAFMDHGVEPRHLKAWRTAAEREAGILEQLTLPIALQGSDTSKARAVALAGDLVALGGELRYAMLRRSLRSSLGNH